MGGRLRGRYGLGGWCRECWFGSRRGVARLPWGEGGGGSLLFLLGLRSRMGKNVWRVSGRAVSWHWAKGLLCA